jgi:tetratricopeptide (TPR) repeat protein
MNISRPGLGRRAAALVLLVAIAVALGGCGGDTKRKKPRPVPADPAGPNAAQLATEARAAVAAGDLDGASAKFHAAYRTSQDLSILEEHVAVFVEHRRFRPAIDLARDYYDAHPTDARGIHLYGQALLAAGDFVTALEVAEELIALDENDAAAHQKRGHALVLAGQVDAGVEALRRADALSPRTPEILTDLGWALHRAGRLDEAALHLRGAMQLDPESWRAPMLLGLALADQAELEEAQVYLFKATKHTRHAQPWFELGVVQNKRGDDLGAEASLARAVGIEPDNALYQYAYGEMLRFNQRFDEAIAAYRRSIELPSPHPKATSKLGLALFEARRFGEAEAFLTDAIRSDPKNEYNYHNLAIVYREQNKTKLAMDMYEKFLQLAAPNDPERSVADACLKNLKRKRKCDR